MGNKPATNSYSLALIGIKFTSQPFCLFDLLPHSVTKPRALCTKKAIVNRPNNAQICRYATRVLPQNFEILRGAHMRSLFRLRAAINSKDAFRWR